MGRHRGHAGWGALIILGTSLGSICVGQLARGQSESQRKRDTTNLQLIGDIKDAVPDEAIGDHTPRGDVSMQQSMAVCDAAVRTADKINTPMTIAVVDAGGHLKYFRRMDGAWIGSIDLAIKKAKTARFFDMKTGEIGKLSQPGGPLYNIEQTNGGLVTFPGGAPLYDARGQIIGAVGVAGSTVENDRLVAEAAGQAL